MGDSGLDIYRRMSAILQDKQNERTEVLSVPAQHHQQWYRHSTLLSKGFSTEHLSGRVSGLCLMILHAPSLFHASLLLTPKTLYRNIIESTAENHLSCFAWMKD